MIQVHAIPDWLLPSIVGRNNDQQTAELRPIEDLDGDFILDVKNADNPEFRMNERITRPRDSRNDEMRNFFTLKDHRPIVTTV